jgi:hypothetical protein
MTVSAELVEPPEEVLCPSLYIAAAIVYALETTN